MYRRSAALTFAGICILAAGCSAGSNQSVKTSTTAPPIAEAALDGLLLSPVQINADMGATGMTVKDTSTKMGDDSNNIPDKDCLPVYSAGEAPVYAGSNWNAIREQHVNEPVNDVAHYVDQVLVSFPSANNAAAFFTASTQRWQACSNRKYTDTFKSTPTVWTNGPISNTNGTLSTVATAEDVKWTCQRALTVRNNVAIDIVACSANPADSAVNIANQIAAKVAKQ